MSLVYTLVLTNGWILTKLAYKQHWYKGRSGYSLVTLASFSRSHRHFNIKFWPNKLICTLSLEPNDGFRLSSMYCIIGIVKKYLIRFWGPWPIYQGHNTIRTVKISFLSSAAYLVNQWVDFDFLNNSNLAYKNLYTRHHGEVSVMFCSLSSKSMGGFWFFLTIRT